MAPPENIKGNYAKCPPRDPMAPVVDEELAKTIADNAVVIPLFEKGMFEHAYKRHSSLLRNANLKCAWGEYKKNFESRVIAPFQFPDQRDLHFYNGTIKFIPSETDFKRKSFRKTLKPGPGVDYGGQMPIPQELLMKRNIVFIDDKIGKEKKLTSKSVKGKKKGAEKQEKTLQLKITEK